MHINNPDALKNWLTIILEPLCDADPPALSRYVLALLKKDKPIKELSQCMAEQLDVFLGVETKPFLDRLFHVIKTEEYLTSVEPVNNIVITATTTTSPKSIALDKVIESSNLLMVEKDTHHENTPPLVEGKAKEPVVSKKINDDHLPSKLLLASNPVLQPNSQTAVVSPTCKSHEPSPIKDKLEKESSSVREVRRRRISLRSRSRSRSRSYDRSRRSRSRERRVNDREKNNRQFRNKSPPPPSNRDRYIRRAERSPRSYGRIRHRSNSASRSRSGSPDRRKVSRSMSPTNEDAPPIKRMRCRDFDEKGYCMRGETCPWDHGIDPVVLEDINNSSLITSIQTSGNANHSLRGAPIHGEYSPDAPDLWNRGGNFSGPRTNAPHRTGGNTGTYPRGPGTNFRGIPPFPFPVNPAATTPLQRELIPVPVVDGNSNNVNNNMGNPDSMSSQSKRRYEPEDTVAIAEAPTRRKIPINNRLGPRPQQNCSLELRKVPRGLNSIAHLNNHFSKFGKIVNIQISYDGDPEAAIITFSSHAEANVAYRSTEAVLNNRFIKVFWHTPGANSNSGETSINNIASTIKDEVPSRRIFTSQHTLSNIPATPIATTTDNANSDTSKSNSLVNSTASVATGASTTNSTTITTANAIINTATLPQTAAQIRLKNSRITRATNELIRKKQEEQVKNAVQIAHGLHKRKHDLLQEYLKQMRSALELVERAEHSDPKRSKLLSTIKDLQASIDKLRKEIAAEQAQMTAQISQSNPAAPIKKSKEQQQKELLDIELELITQQQEGHDTTAIQKRLHELQRSYGTTTNRPHFPRTQRVRPAPPGSTSVDRRPTTITIVGFSLEESDSILGHFKHFGEITKNQLDKTVPSLTISYATRSSAEQAMSRGRTFKEKRLQLTWLLPAIVVQPKNENINTENIENSEPSTAELTLEDEEEEEDTESEDRSWRR